MAPVDPLAPPNTGNLLANNRPVVMTELGLFPRGKSSVAQVPSPGSATSHNNANFKGQHSEDVGKHGGKKAGHKRKAPGASSPGAAAGGDKDWLFGSPQQLKGARISGSSMRKSPLSDGTTGGSRIRGDKKPSLATGEVGTGMLMARTGRAPRLEMVSFKKLSKGTLVLGVVFKVNEHDMVVSLPSSLTGVVRKNEVSDYFHAKSSAAGKKKSTHGGRGRYFDNGAAGEPLLTDMFREGQVVRCAILSLAKEVDGRHIELSLRASVVNKGLSLSQLAAGCGVYGSVASAEDHGYVVWLGLEGLTAFLPSKDAPEGGLRAGQPVEAIIKTVNSAARTLTLSAEAGLAASAVTKGTAFNLRSLKPGMLVDTIVDSVLSNGMLVSFLGYFAGCVDHNNMPVVSGDGKEEETGWRTMFKAGPEPVRARLLMVDYNNKAIRLTLRPHLLEMRAPSGLPPTGALLDGEVVRIDPALGLLLKVPSTERDGGAVAKGNVPPPKKEKGQARRERRAKAATEAAAAAERDAIDEGVEGDTVGAVKTSHVGAYVHISRISDERVEHVERLYKPGQKVRCRVTGSSLVEGWAAVSLRPSVLAAAVLRYQDLRPGSLVEGEIAAVEAFGVLVKLGEGVRALVPKNHLGDVGVKNPKSRFKVGARVKGRVLTVDTGSSKATLTLKRSMTKDMRDPITCYEEAKEGVACTGFVTKVASFGLHVSFYGNVFGVLPNKALTRHGIEDPSEAFTVGQVIGCVVKKCDATTYPPKLSLGLDVAGKTEKMGEEEDGDDAPEAVVCPFSPGDIVSGVVSFEQGRKRSEITVDLNPDIKEDDDSEAPPGSKTPSKTSPVRGILPYVHLGDHAALCGEKLAAKLTPGTSIERLLVVEVDRLGIPLVSLKPLLLLSAQSAEKGTENAAEGEGEGRRSHQAFMPKRVADLSPGDLVAGFVSKVERFGVFVRFLAKFTGLAPRAMVADRIVEDPTGMFEEGDSVRCVVKRVDTETGRVAVTLSRATVPASPALYLRSLLSETFAVKGTARSPYNPEEAGDGEREEAAVPSWSRLEFGTTTNATVVAVKEYGIVLKASAGGLGKKARSAQGAGQLMVCPLEHAPDGVKEGLEVKVRILGVDLEKGVVDVTMDPDLVKAGRSKRRRSMASLEPGERVSVKLVFAKPHAKYAVAASADGRVFVVQVADFHCPHRTNQDAGLAATPEGDTKELECRVGDSFSSAGEGYWEGEEGGAGASGCNPFAGAVLIVPEEGDASGKRKGSRSRKNEQRSGDLELGDKRDMKHDALLNDPMKAGKVALGNVVPGAEVACEVMSIHEDRLDVKLAVRYPRSYGPWAGKGRSGSIGGEEEEDEQEEEPVEQAAAPARKKRRRDEETTTVANDVKESNTNGHANYRKNIVRIRAKVHCTAAGKPLMDAPCKTNISRSGEANGESGVILPDWHPLAKYHVGQVLRTRVLHSEDQPVKDGSNLVFRLIALEVVGAVPDAEEEGNLRSSFPMKSIPWWGENDPKRGEVHRGVIIEVAESGVMVSLSTCVRGLLPWASVSTDSGGKLLSRALFKKGMGVRVLVRSVDGKRHRLILTLVGVPSTDVLPDSALPAMSPDAVVAQKQETDAAKEKQKLAFAGDDDAGSSTPSPGDLVEGRVVLSKPWRPPCLMVRLDGGVMGRVCFTELAEEGDWKKEPLTKFRDGRKVKCRVMHPVKTRELSSCTAAKRVPVELSMRASRLDSDMDAESAIKREDAPAVGAVVKCYVVETGKSGCFVRLAGNVSGRVLLKLLSDRFISNPAAEFPCGRLVVGKVLEKDDATGQVSLTLQASAVPIDGTEGGLSWDSPTLKKGLKVKGRVTSVKDFGVFIQIEDSSVSGMCHRTEAADQKIDDLTTVYDQGDLVKAIVLSVDKKKKRISLGLKARYFQGDPESSSDSEGAEDDVGFDKSDGEDEHEDGQELSSVEDMKNAQETDGATGEQTDPKATDTNEDTIITTKTSRKQHKGEHKDKVVAAMERDESEDEEESQDEHEEESDSEAEKPFKRLRGMLGGGLGHEASSGSNAFSLHFGDFGVGGGGGGAGSDEDDSSSDDSEEEEAGGNKGHRSRKKAKERREEEERIVARERALQDDDAAPETDGDFERLLIATPNDSFLWVKYMAFKLSLADVDGARAAAERGLKAISFRQEQERYNLWVSLLNLEHKFGTGDSLKKAFERACRNGNPKKIYLHLAETHDKAKETEQCEEVFHAAAKKFRHSKKVWIAYQLSRLRRGDDAGAREILQRSLQSLGKHKHVSVISRFAQNEFEHGSVERGRSIFEGLMSSYPKRLDLWNVYLDKEVKAGDIGAARNLLERLTGMDFNAKRMKGVFKKYLQFEMDKGDEAGVDNVKAKATEYVASLTGNPGVSQR